jgi:uncharacterized protein YdaU (DUF1376 family)
MDKRNRELSDYISKHKKTSMPETNLPCILNTNYYKAKQQNPASDLHILARLTQERMKSESGLNKTSSQS